MVQWNNTVHSILITTHSTMRVENAAVSAIIFPILPFPDSSSLYAALVQVTSVEKTSDALTIHHLKYI